MKKVKISITEELKYSREMIFEVPDDMSDDEINDLLDDVQSKAETSSDIPILLTKNNNAIKIVEVPDNDLSSPYSSEIEIEEYDFLEGDEENAD